MPDATPELLNELVTLHRLTQTEAQIANVRTAQARDERIRQELAENAQKCEERIGRLDEAIRALGGVPDVAGAVLGRLAANATFILNQGQPLTEALLTDLALEHQLHDRAIYTKVLAETAGNTEVRQLAEHLELAHAATVAWIHTRLAEVGMGGPVALRPTPTQFVAQAARSLAVLPVQVGSQQVNQLIDRLSALPEQVGEAASTTTERVRKIAESVVDVLVAGVDASLEQAEEEAQEQGANEAAGAVHETRENLGLLNPEELPVQGFDSLPGNTVISRIRSLSTPEDLRTLLAYEQSHKNREGVVRALSARIDEVAAGRATSS